MLERRNALGVAQIPPAPAPVTTPDEKLDNISQQLQRLVEIGEQLIEGVSITCITIEPRTIADFLQVISPPGKTQSMSAAVPIACPAGVTTQWAFRMPPGWVSVIRRSYVYSSDFYDPNFTLEAWIEENRIPITWGAMPLTGPRTMGMDFIIKKYGMDVEFVNGTATDALVTLELQAFWLEKSYFEEFYEPLVGKIYHAAEALIR